MIKIGILGAGGRMGQAIAREVFANAQTMTLHAAIDQENHPLIGRDIGEVLGLQARGVEITAAKRDAFDSCDVLIDFTTKTATIEHAGLAARSKKPFVIGTTGFGTEEKTALRDAAKTAAIVAAPNMSIGVNILLPLIESAAKKLGPEFDIEIFEAHHRHKADAPSGTSLALAEAAAKGRGVLLKDVMVTDRANHPSSRKVGSIGISVFRGGDIAGEHTVTFAGNGEQVSFSHKASDRSLFAKGAIRAALWLKGKPAGLYSMQDVLG